MPSFDPAEKPSQGPATYQVCKFGGSSVGQISRIAQCLERLKEQVIEGPSPVVVVVVSAPGKSTQSLTGIFFDNDPLAFGHWALELQELLPSGALEKSELHSSWDELIEEGHWLLDQSDCLSREEGVQNQLLDQFLSLGERFSRLIFTAHLEAMGLKARGLSALECVRTDIHFGHAHVDVEASCKLIAQHIEEIENDGIGFIVTEGFIGRSSSGAITTLGLEGSDATAALFAKAIKMHLCASGDELKLTIFSDTDGLYDADPLIFPKAQRLKVVGVQFLKLFCDFGLKVLHRSVLDLLDLEGIRLMLKSSQAPGPGTSVVATGPAPENMIVDVSPLAKVGDTYKPWAHLGHQERQEANRRDDLMKRGYFRNGVLVDWEILDLGKTPRILRVGVLGRGRTGGHVVELLEDKAQDTLANPFPNLVLKDVFHRQNPFTALKAQECDVVIAFIDATALAQVWEELTQCHCPVVLGTTGFSFSRKQLTELKEKNCRWLLGRNFSWGINWLKECFVHLAAHEKGSLVLLDHHHIHKKDAPSGTAVLIKEWIGKRDVKIESMRQGEEIGRHTLTLELADERLEIAHQATHRRVFARGALEAAESFAKLHSAPVGLTYYEDFINHTL